MLKSDKIFHAVKELKKDLSLNRRKGSFREYGSFYHPRKKYVSDIDIHYLLNVENISSEENYIKDIIKNISTYKKIKLFNIYVGHHEIYYKKNITEKDLKKLNKEGFIKDCKYKSLVNLLNKYKNNSNPLLKHLLDDDLSVKWTLKDLEKGIVKIKGKEFELKKCLQEDNFLWLDLIFCYKKKYIPMEFIIMPKKTFTDKEEKKKIYNGCKLALIEYCCKKYYNFLKRIKACYGYNIKTNNYTEFMKEQYEELHQYFETIDKKISIYHLKIGDLKMNEKSEKLPKLEKKFNNIFKETANMYYKIGKENEFIY